jgi:hypothetical protein
MRFSPTSELLNDVREADFRRAWEFADVIVRSRQYRRACLSSSEPSDMHRVSQGPGFLGRGLSARWDALGGVLGHRWGL